MGRDTGWVEQGSSHSRGGDNWIWDILLRKRWQHELMDWMWNITREESRMTIKFWPEEWKGRIAIYWDGVVRGKASSWVKRTSPALRIFVVFEQIFYRVNSLSQLNALIQFLNGKVGVFPTFSISLKLFSVQNLQQNSESLISFCLEQIVLIIAAAIISTMSYFSGYSFNCCQFYFNRLFLPVSILPKISKIFNDTYETLNQFIYKNFTM